MTDREVRRSPDGGFPLRLSSPLTYGAIMTEQRNIGLTGRMIEVHLLNGKRFLGLVLEKDRDGISLRCLPLRVLETAPEGGDIAGQLRSMISTRFFPYINIEYVDIGGEPVGYDVLFAKWFGGGSIIEFFDPAPERPEAGHD